MAIAAPFNLKKWIDDHRDLLKPPVGNQCVYKDAENFIVMVVGGPNSRKDYHYNESEELYYQLEGNIVLKIIDGGVPKDIPINEGDMFLLPPKTPHSPQRGPNTVGLVIECKRDDREVEDGLQWYCEQCNNLLHEYKFVLHNVEKDFLPRFRDFYASEDLRTCKKCGHVMETDPRFV